MGNFYRNRLALGAIPQMAIGADYKIRLLLHMNGADASTVFTDEKGHTFTTYNHAQLSTTAPKLGTAAGLFDGTDDYIDTPDSADFDVASGDFTVDFWVKRAGGVNSRQFICGQGSSSATEYPFLIEFKTTNVIRCSGIKTDTSAAYDFSSTRTITDTTTWHHIALVRDTNTMRLFIDGVADGTANVTGLTLINATTKLSIGRGGEYNVAYLNARIDEFRYSVGIARWVVNFTPPTAEYS